MKWLYHHRTGVSHLVKTTKTPIYPYESLCDNKYRANDLEDLGYALTKCWQCRQKEEK